MPARTRSAAIDTRSTISGYRGYVDKHVRPFIGQVKVSALDAEMLDSLYAELRRCRDHCSGRKQIQHRCAGSHQCDERCRKHECRPLANATIRKIHFVLGGAYKQAVRWRWVSTNPMTQAEPPPAPPPDPQPPSAPEAAQLLREAWLDPDWGALIWLTMTTGARRGELCALRWKHVDLTTGLLTLRRAIAQDGVKVEEKDTKTHQRRHVTLDPETVAVLTEHHERCSERAAVLGVALDKDAFVFSNDPVGRTHLIPSSITQRYRRMAERLKIETHFHNLRHYSATELIAAGVDIRTVAGRLGHGGGGTTTLRVYAAWVAEADQRAATRLVSRLPARPSSMPTRMDRILADPRTPYERIAAKLHAGIVGGLYPRGEPLPTGKELAKTYGVAAGTAQRAVTLLSSWGLIEVNRGQRAVVRAVSSPVDERDASGEAVSTVQTDSTAGNASEIEILLDLEVRRRGNVVSKFSAEADPKSPRELRQLLLDAVRRDGRDESQIAEYEMDIRYFGDRSLVTTFVARTR